MIEHCANASIKWQNSRRIFNSNVFFVNSSQQCCFWCWNIDKNQFITNFRHNTNSMNRSFCQHFPLRMVKKTTKFHWNEIVADSTLKFIAIKFIDFCIFASTLFAALFLGVAQLTTAIICAWHCMLVIGIEPSNVQYIQIFRNELNLFTCFCSFSLFVCH